MNGVVWCKGSAKSVSESTETANFSVWCSLVHGVCSIEKKSENLGKNPVALIGSIGGILGTTYSRYLFHFDETLLQNLYDNCELGDLSNVKHILNFTPTRTYDGVYCAPAELP